MNKQDEKIILQVLKNFQKRITDLEEVVDELSKNQINISKILLLDKDTLSKNGLKNTKV